MFNELPVTSPMLSTPSLPAEITGESFRSWKKAELHAHLNGCVPTHVAQKLLRDFNVTLPEGFDPNVDLQVLQPVTGLAQYFRPWYLLKLLPVGRECLFQMVAASVSTLRDDGIEYVELRNSPFSIASRNNISLAECLDWMTDSLAQAREVHKIDARLILSLSRFDCSPDQAERLLSAIKASNGRELIVGVDLSGDEDKPVDRSLAGYFREARDQLGLGVSIHAGETFIAANVEWAVNECRAHRVGHALAVATQPRLLELLESKGVCVEVCLSSNFLTQKVAELEHHPVRQLLDRQIPFVLCADNPAIHAKSLSDEYALFALKFPDSRALDTMYDTQIRHSFRDLNK
jgi:adenosine deaminase